MTGPAAALSHAARDEMTWRAHLVFAQLMHCRAVAQLSAEDRQELEAHCGASLADSVETGRLLLGLTRTELVALADHLDGPWEHAAIRQAVDIFRREGMPQVEARAFRAALLRRARQDLNGRRA